MAFDLPSCFYEEEYNARRRAVGTRAGGILLDSAAFAALGYRAQSKLVADFERSVFRAAQATARETYVHESWLAREFVALYDAAAFRALCNIDPLSPVGPAAEELRAALIEGRTDAARFAEQTEVQMLPARYAGRLARIRARLEQRVVKRISTTVTCPRCKTYTCEWYTVQRRALDEPSTTIYECTECKAKRYI